MCFLQRYLNNLEKTLEFVGLKKVFILKRVDYREKNRKYLLSLEENCNFGKYFALKRNVHPNLDLHIINKVL